ncbi:methanethiol S-methyltransferase [Nevskia sp.]|uniref:methanethiol S-methyltransferase n=1 Tax=Nevskia sp. TaxID=1929292 RepID=UPI0025F71AC3|nr:methanethiol S-methyltransferase [Nevskia sp.]
MNRYLSFAYGVACYGLFFAVFVYLIGFLNDVGVLKSVNSGLPGPVATALFVDIGLITLFGVQHSVMARPWFKRRLTQFVPHVIERSSYVLATNVVLILTYLFWEPLPGVVWQIREPMLSTALYMLAAVGWLIVLISTFLTNHFDLFGLRQVWLNLLRRNYSAVAFKEHLFYRWVRHPMMLGLFIALWATPEMTVSHLLFSVGMSIYIVVGVHFEEAGLKKELGKPYQDYVARTGRFLPF